MGVLSEGAVLLTRWYGRRLARAAALPAREVREAVQDRDLTNRLGAGQRSAVESGASGGVPVMARTITNARLRDEPLQGRPAVSWAGARSRR